jgi:regulatory protein
MDRESALKKAIHFCEYQERSKQEVAERLNEWGIDENLIPSIIDQLVSNNYIHEGRFAREYAHGKFKIKGWGKIRIRQGLLRKGIPENLIDQGLKAIDEEEYLSKVQALIDKKMEIECEKEKGESKPLNEYEKNNKVAKYILSHGYEPDLVWKFLKHEEI